MIKMRFTNSFFNLNFRLEYCSLVRIWLVFILKLHSKRVKQIPFSRNCNHFSDALCCALLNVGIPSYINRLAWWGGLFKCFLPGGSEFSAPLLPRVNQTNNEIFIG